MHWIRRSFITTVVAWLAADGDSAAAVSPPARIFLEKHCIACHDSATKEGGLDLTALPADAAGAGHAFHVWVRVHDRIVAGEMPPEDEARPDADEAGAYTADLDRWLGAVDEARIASEGRARSRRLTAAEYETVLRDLLALPGLSLRRQLPADDLRHGYDKLGEAVSLSPVHLAKYMEAAEYALRQAVATRSTPPPVYRKRIFPTQVTETWSWLARGDAVALKDGRHDPHVPLPSPDEKPFVGPDAQARRTLIDQLKLRDYEGGVGFFSGPVDQDWRLTLHFAPVYAGHYRVRMSAWSFWWNQGAVEPAKRTESFMLSLWLPEPGIRYPQNQARTLGMFDAPALDAGGPRVHECVEWMEVDEELLFEVGTLTGFGRQHGRWVAQEPGSAAGYSGPGIAIDWYEVEGPIHDSWPPESHQRLFGALPIESLDAKQFTHLPPRAPVQQIAYHCRPTNGDIPKADREPPLESVASRTPEDDAGQLIAAFLPRAFRRDVSAEEVWSYVAIMRARLAAGDCFEEAMLAAYRAVLCSHEFLYVNLPVQSMVGPSAALTDRRLTAEALATRLSLWLWDSLPDERLLDRARSGAIAHPTVLAAEVNRLLDDPKFDRFVERFLDQWLNLRKLDETTPDRRMYPEYRHILRESMAEESRAFFKELVQHDLPITNIVVSDFAMLNRPLADLYRIPGVEGCELRRVPLPPESHRGGLITQASVLKVTANGTNTSPVNRGVFFMERILGTGIPPPPANVNAIDPDTRGATTIREQLAKHQSDASCAACHRVLDPPGFALESFDVIGGHRQRYRTLGSGDAADVAFAAGWKPGWRQGPPVDPSGTLADGRTFADIDGLRSLLTADPDALTRAFAKQILMYATGTDIHYADRREIDRIVTVSREHGHGIRGLFQLVADSDSSAASKHCSLWIKSLPPQQNLWVNSGSGRFPIT
ncbi:MAG: DUF1592 domain-containing protein [Pirellulales bacterium]